MKRVAVIALLLLTSCSREPQIRELADPSINNLMAQPLHRFFASLHVAQELAKRCPEVDYAHDVAHAVSDARLRVAGRGAVSYTHLTLPTIA